MASIEIRVGAQRVEQVALRLGSTVVGRADDSDLCVGSLGLSDVSGHHLELIRGPDGVRAKDLGSRNGSTLNGDAFEGEVAVHHGDVVGLGGQLTLRVELSGVGLLPGPVTEALPVLPAPLARAVETSVSWLSREHDAQAWALSRAAELCRAPTVAARLRLVVGWGRELCAADAVWALQWEAGPDGAVRYRSLIHDGETGAVPHPEAVSSSVVGRAVQRGAAVWSDEPESDPRFSSSHSVMALTGRSVGAVPLGAQTVLWIAATAPPGIDATARARIEALGRLAAPMVGEAAPREAPRPAALPGLVARSDAMLDLAEQLQTFAMLGYRILLLGERGTGKSHLARLAHAASGVSGEFVHADCPNLVSTLAESLLFGHEKGSFANATARHIGWVERANGGTLFLDEVGDLPPEVQPKLLTVLQEGTFERVGGRQRLGFTGQVISATNQDLEGPAGPGFRRDLYDRLAQVVLRIPPLRERREDIEPLAWHFFEVESKRILDRGLTPPSDLSASALRSMRAMDLPGNARALSSVVIRGMGRAILEGSPTVEHRHLTGPGPDVPRVPEVTDYWEAVHAFERSLLQDALGRHDGNQTRARTSLGLSNGAWDRAKKRVGLDTG